MPENATFFYFKRIIKKIKKMSDEKNDKKRKSIWAVFVNQDETDKTESTELTKNNNAQQPAPVVTQTPVIAASTMPSIPSMGAFNQGMFEHLMKLLEDNNLPGIDYWEFQQTKKQMDGQAGMTEQIKYASAFIGMKTASGNKLTKESLLEAADFYIGVIDKEVVEFNKESAKSKAEKVDSLIAEAKSKEGSIEQKILQINAINEEISKLRTDANSLQNEAQNNAVKIDNAIKNFATTSEVAKKQINDDKMNISAFIQ